MIHKKIIIIGGGVTGLSAASFLNDDDWLLLEASDILGGYCKTTIRNGYVWDYSGHFYHFKNPEIQSYATKLMDCELLTIKKTSYIKYKNELIDFPFQHNIHQLDKSEFIECLTDLFFKTDGGENFKDYIKNNLGNAISEKFVIPYNEKLYACDLNTLDKDCMGRFFPETSFQSVMETISGKKQKSYNDQFIYPKNGAYEFIKSIFRNIKQKDNIKLNETVETIDLQAKTLKTNGGEYSFDFLISTIPFDTLLSKSSLPDSELNYNKVVVFNIGFDKKSTCDAHWIYFPGDEVFYRVGFYDNILSSDKMSIYVEIGLEKNEVVNERQLLQKTVQDLKRSGIITDQKIVDYQMLVLKPAYVHITEMSRKLYKEWCSVYNNSNIYSIGRYGSWTYCSIEDNIIQAKRIVQELNL